ncbi:branched-chain amino acid ABC transporter permease [Roseibacterium sp. SDUM158016]|uniref:branched-chain amino acid ABC transporter permease n=1 Tax=Roseicyclus sediminis TaxID=2980997 RepID=UPI0021CF2F6F|nr:branched-chain amino acid ABC transporter permease [Roseibacterium sp. SDUM158016]MCU4652111.1 branched-chain amino acid ABC transporter permease [Roseibacterium sp. SDUM158016]
MIHFYYSYQPVIDFFLLSLGFAYSQQIALRAGVFSIGTAGFAALGGYLVAILATRTEVPMWVIIPAGAAIGALGGYVLSIPLARLRGAFVAIATLAFVKVIIALALYFEDLTGGAIGVTNIPRIMDTWSLALMALLVIYVNWSIGRTTLGRIFAALAQDESVAASLGVSIRRYHMIGFMVSGAIGGLFGGLQSLYVYNIEPNAFGFAFVVTILTVVVLGGRTTLLGPIMGAGIMAILPEVARPLADNRTMVNGIIMILVITFLPRGVGDTIVDAVRHRWRQRRGASRPQKQEVADAVASD